MTSGCASVWSAKLTCTFIVKTAGTIALFNRQVIMQSDSDLIFRRTLLGYYAEGMQANFK